MEAEQYGEKDFSLVTTALEKTWPSVDKKIIFFGSGSNYMKGSRFGNNMTI